LIAGLGRRRAAALGERLRWRWRWLNSLTRPHAALNHLYAGLRNPVEPTVAKRSPEVIGSATPVFHNSDDFRVLALGLLGLEFV
jgi:hypothetical protein